MSTAEVITACDNLCRDYYWLFSGDPRIVQGLLTVGAAAITSATALFIALRVYPIQKLKDKDLQIQAETRSVYADTVAALGDYFAFVCRNRSYLAANLEEGKLAWTKVVHQQGILRIYASDLVIEKVDSFAKDLKKFRETKLDSDLESEDKQAWRAEVQKVHNNCIAARKLMVSVMRSDLKQESLSEESSTSVHD